MAETTAPLSEAELRFYLTRATVGAGLGFGIGSDLARATLTLLRAGEDPLGEISIALEAVAAEGSVAGFEPGETGLAGEACMLRVQGGGTGSGIALAVVLVDLAALGVRQVGISGTGSVDSPELCARLASALLAPGVSLQAVISGDEVRFSLQETQSPEVAEPARRGFSVDAASWQRIMSLFKRCLVPSDESSRLSGAGAGLVDED